MLLWIENCPISVQIYLLLIMRYLLSWSNAWSSHEKWQGTRWLMDFQYLMLLVRQRYLPDMLVRYHLTCVPYFRQSWMNPSVYNSILYLVTTHNSISMQYIFLSVTLIVVAFTTWVSAPIFGYPLNGMSQADISNMYRTAITPAGFTFAIWSAIYLSWIVVGLVIARAPLTSLTRWMFPRLAKYIESIEVRSSVIFPYSLAIGLTAVWLVPWAYNMIGISLVIMLILLGVLKYTFHVSRKESPLIRGSVELFIGWINIAMVANITIWLVSLGFSGGGIAEIYWAIGVLGLALLLTLYYQYRYRAYMISLVFLWAMFGVLAAHDTPLQRIVVMVYMVIAIVSMGYTYMKK